MTRYALIESMADMKHIARVDNTKEAVRVYEEQRNGHSSTESDSEAGEYHEKPTQEWRQRWRARNFLSAAKPWRRTRWV
jgi:hypothetical protein